MVSDHMISVVIKKAKICTHYHTLIYITVSYTANLRYAYVGWTVSRIGPQEKVCRHNFDNQRFIQHFTTKGIVYNYSCCITKATAVHQYYVVILLHQLWPYRCGSLTSDINTDIISVDQTGCNSSGRGHTEDNRDIVQ